MKIKPRILVAPLCALLVQGVMVKANLQDQYNNASSVSSSQAQYFGVDSNIFGKSWSVSYYVDGKGNIFSFIEGSSSGSLVGVIGRKYSATSNTCLFGTNVECMSNTMTTISQYGIDSADGFERCGLYKYSTTSLDLHSSPFLRDDGSSSDVSRKELGVCNSALLQETTSSQKNSEGSEGTQDSAIDIARNAAVASAGSS